MLIRLLLPLAVVCLAGLSGREAAAQAPSAAGWGQADQASQLRLLGIEPLAPPENRPASPHAGGTAHWNGPVEELPGGAVQVQYPLDNRIWEQPPSDDWPRHSRPGRPGQTSVPYTTDPSAAVDDSWFQFKELYTELTYIANTGGVDAVGWTSFDLRTRFEFPAAPMLAVAPRAGWQFVHGPSSTDLPSQLYDASLEMIVSLPLWENWFVQTAVSPSFFTDGDNTSSDAFRLPGRILLFWKCTEHLTLSGGLAYLDREDISFLPNVGLIYRPSDDFKLELIIPRPRVAWRISGDGQTDRWAYVVGELGGGSWGVRRSAGFNDVATYGDYRAMLGWEQLQKSGVDLRCEVGVVFSRTLEYVSSVGNRDLPSTGLVRIALTY